MGIVIRRANNEDADGIRRVAQTRWVSSDSKEKTGLIDYTIPDAAKYSHRISSGLVYIVLESKREEVLGFIDAYPNERLKELFVNDPVVNRIILSERRPFLYINTLAILKEHEGTGLSSSLLEVLLKDLDKKYKSVWAAIVHKPLRNEISAAFSQKHGFSLKREMRAFGKYTFGLYRKSLN